MKKKIIIFPDINLLNSFVEEKINEKLTNYKLKHPIHFPDYLFKINKLNIKDTKLQKKFNLPQNSYLSDLESESIHIIREVVSETKNPVMLYSLGKDSSVTVSYTHLTLPTICSV